MAWLDEYKLTYSPSPPSSFALSLYGGEREEEHRPWREGGRGGDDEEEEVDTPPTVGRYEHVSGEDHD